MTLAGLPDYVRNFNKTSAPSKLNIWVSTRAEMGKLQDPVTVRLILPDILVAYCVLSAPTGASGLSAETVTVSGPREQVPNAFREISPTLIASFPDQAALPIRAHRLSEGVPADRKNGSGLSAGVVSTIDGEVQTPDLHFFPTDFAAPVCRVSCYRTGICFTPAVPFVRGYCRWRRTFRLSRECGSRARLEGGDGTRDTLPVSRRRTSLTHLNPSANHDILSIRFSGINTGGPGPRDPESTLRQGWPQLLPSSISFFPFSSFTTEFRGGRPTPALHDSI